MEQGGRYIESTEDFLRRTGHWLETELPEEEIDAQLASDFADFAEPELRASLLPMDEPLPRTLTPKLNAQPNHQAGCLPRSSLLCAVWRMTASACRRSKILHVVTLVVNNAAEADAGVDDGAFRTLAPVEEEEDGEPAEEGGGDEGRAGYAEQDQDAQGEATDL